MLQVNGSARDLKRQLIYSREVTDSPRWLDEAERAAWMELVRVLLTLPAALDTHCAATPT
ncbi:hypothetical protein C8E89_13427 [Mycolicibacterium moriokaense]|uniref:Uncharacterized protein n=1 Tax=Mycolicibacterium moriokaense TaxID=39691 RepID=A0A318HIF5_9MYCO|nr:hypothetical protein C8E89_13427 [Mycolicibacterium moriokaense]